VNPSSFRYTGHSQGNTPEILIGFGVLEFLPRRSADGTDIDEPLPAGALIEIQVDMKAIGRQLAERAVTSKRKKSSGLGGAIVVKVRGRIQ
jgi:hypothetical protein